MVQLDKVFDSVLIGKPMLERIVILDNVAMRIAVKIISIIPDDLAQELNNQDIYIFARDLKDIGFRDILNPWNEDEINRQRIEKAREFLKDSFLSFKVFRNDPNSRFFNGTNVRKHVLPSAIKLNDISYTPIPILNHIDSQKLGKVIFNRLPSNDMDYYRFPEYPPFFVAYRDYYFGCNSGWEGTWFGTWTLYPPDGEEVKVVSKDPLTEERIIYRDDYRLMFMTNQDVFQVAMRMENVPGINLDEFAVMFKDKVIGSTVKPTEVNPYQPEIGNGSNGLKGQEGLSANENATGAENLPKFEPPYLRDSEQTSAISASFESNESNKFGFPAETKSTMESTTLLSGDSPVSVENGDPDFGEEMEPDAEKENAYYSEEEFVNRLEKLALSSQLVYDRDDLVNFHTAVKTGSLVILAGMSGVGKSQLVINYAKALGLAGAGDLSQANPQFLFIPVRPNWNDDSDLIGYYDAVHKVYRPAETGLVDLLIEAEKNDNEYRSGKSEYRLYFVCFDEMNLARVEHYFSQFLSILELNEPRYLNLYSEKLAPEVYNRHEYKPKIRIGSNVHFIGTVNVDESSYPFSDKVLDRANVIHLKVNESLREWNQKLSEYVDLNRRGKERHETKGASNQTISGSTFASWCIPDSGRTGFTMDELDFLDALNRELRQIDKEKVVGYRVLRQIASYLRNIPQSSSNDPLLDRREAFDLQVVQRILTKIKGPETDLGQFFGKYTQRDQAKGKMVEIMNEHGQVSDFKHSRDICYRKAKELVDHGYAS